MATPCPLCLATNRIPIHELGRGGPLATGACRKCGLVQVDSRPSQSELARMYASGEFSTTARGANSPDHKKLAATDRAALQRLQRLDGEKRSKIPAGPVLEIGCGLGSFLFAMRGRGREVHGIEPDPTYAKLAAQWHGVQTDAATLEEVQLPERKYALIASFHVLEHLHDPLAALKLMRDALMDEGKLYLEVPSVDRPYSGNLDYFFWAPHLQYFSRLTLRALLQKAGFAVEAIGHAGDFLWCIAKKDERREPRLPVENPDKVVRQLHHAKAQFDGPKRPLAKQIVRDAVRTIEKDAGQFMRTLGSKGVRVKEEVGNRWRARTGDTWTHFAVPGHANNSGDTVLFQATRDALAGDANIGWQIFNLRQPVTPARVEQVNQTDAVIVGGGGLFLADTVPDSASGWQWNISREQLAALGKPLAIFAVGFNKFRGQDQFGQEFTKHVQATVEKADFIGLRNSGSMAAIREILPPGLREKIVYQPCPTTVLSRLRGWGQRRPRAKHVTFNAAFDRQPNRFGDDAGKVLGTLADAAKELQAKGWKIHVACHNPEDAKLLPWFDGRGVTYQAHKFWGRSGEATIAHYARMDFAVGMRGHAQMIPFGLGTPIHSLVSHEKMAWFLQDINRPEWGTELLAADLHQRIVAAADAVRDNPKQAFADVLAAGEPLWEVTRNNLQRIRQIVADNKSA